MTTTVPERDRTAERLLASAARVSFDPQVEIDWEAPPTPGLWYGPPERSTLYGTDLWRRMPEEQRIELTKHEVASIASVGIWFETILTQMLVRSLYDRSMTDAHARFAFTEIADECRHSMMFGRMIETLGCPDYGPGRLAHVLARPFKSLSNGTLTFAAALYAEEVLDALQREAMSDERIQPLVRAVNRIHIIEEARHMRYARDETARQVAGLGPLERMSSRAVLTVVAGMSTARLVHPCVYASVGLDPREAREAANTNPHWAATKRFAARKAVDFFTDLGLITSADRRVWRRAGLIA
ncbi:MAG TPA: diiron oxygenase [Frankiaceae bacterium]|nr:diiron oxygenase [Frankiaceae bacterium]